MMNFTPSVPLGIYLDPINGKLVFEPTIEDAAAGFFEASLEVRYASPLASDSESLLLETIPVTFTFDMPLPSENPCRPTSFWIDDDTEQAEDYGKYLFLQGFQTGW